MKNKKWDTVVEKINEFRHINRQTAGGGTAEEPVDIPDDVMIECDGLVKIYKTKDIEVLALQGLDLTVKRGELMAIIGNSGSGKSTFLNMIKACTSIIVAIKPDSSSLSVNISSVTLTVSFSFTIGMTPFSNITIIQFRWFR